MNNIFEILKGLAILELVFQDLEKETNSPRLFNIIPLHLLNPYYYIYKKRLKDLEKDEIT